MGFSYANNARVINDFLYVRDANGNIISGRRVDMGDNITVLDVSYSKQLALVEYPTPSGVSTGYVTNATNCIQYYYQDHYVNGSTSETVYDEYGNVLGSLNPWEKATPLYKKGGKMHVVYSTDKGLNTKSGYVVYNGGFTGFDSNPEPNPPGKTYSDGLDALRYILWSMGFQGTIDVNTPIASIIVGNTEISASIGTSSTIATEAGKLFNFSVTNGTVSLAPSDFPILDFLKLKTRLDEIAAKIRSGNISVTISSKGEFVMEISVNLIKTPISVSSLYCKIKIKANDEDNNLRQQAYYKSYSLSDYRYASVAVIMVILGTAFVLKELARRALTLLAYR
ncbi:hypothetical protein [Desnuesiella massiliensis]|uniref:hypothetical protein n=1 Tax=Desnuesiella massiliensis TaxID=1650662 RepID=UPI000A622158|nr:hypothetical protein [Desnuesiella massiliensis]